MRANLALFGRLTVAAMRGQLQYRASFVLETLAVFVGTGIDFVAILVFFGRVPLIGGWSMPEVVLLYGLVSASLGLAQILGGGFEDFQETVRLGRFDQVLIRPRPTWLQVMGAQFPLRRVGRLLQATLALGLATRWLEPGWGPGQWLFVAWTIAGGTAFFLGLFLVRAATCFVTVESVEVVNILTYGGQEVATYPLHVYGEWMRRIFVYVVPLAFVNYFPALHLLGRRSPFAVPPQIHWLAMPLCLAVLAVGGLAWQAGVLRYQSTGS